MWCDIQKDCANNQYVRIPKIIATISCFPLLNCSLIVSGLLLFRHLFRYSTLTGNATKSKISASAFPPKRLPA